MNKEIVEDLTKHMLADLYELAKKEERNRIEKSISDVNDYIGLEYSLGFLSRIMNLNKNGIKKYLHEKGILEMKNNKYIANENKGTMYINNVLCIKKSIIVKIVSLNIYVEDLELNKLNSKIKELNGKNKDLCCMISYDMHKAENQKNDKKFDRIKKVISITNNVDKV